MSMRLKTIILIILTVFITTVANFFSGLYFTRSSLEETIQQDLKFAISIADKLVGTKMSLMKTTAATVAAQLQASASETELTARMAAQFEAYPDITALSYFDRNGVIASYSVPAHDHDVNLHAEYLELVYNGATIISNPFYCSTHGEFVMNVYTPMGSDGVLAVTMPGLTFSDMLAEHRLWQTGHIFMLNEVGMFIGATDQEFVMAMNEYLADQEDPPDMVVDEIGGLVQKILSSDSGVEYYSVDGVQSLCAYSLIDGSALGWRVAVTAQLNESPQADALRGQLYAAVFFLLVGVAAAFFLSRVTARPFKEIELQNSALAELNKTIQAQAATIQAEHERVRLMLDATPLACRLWDSNFNLVECNEEAVRLFGLKDKRDYLNRYFEFSPEYQPDGQVTRDKIRRVVSEAFEKGECVYEWQYRLSDDTPIPSEIIMVRVPYGNDYVVASYSRDLREQKKMMADIEHRDNLLDAGRRVSSILFDTAEDKDIEAVLVKSMELLGRIVGADQAYITQNETVDGAPYFTCRSAWVGGSADARPAIGPGMRFPWGLDLDWDVRFRRGECMNGPVKDMPAAIQGFFSPFKTKSVLVVPVFVQEQFWGLVGFSDCRRDRFFGADEVDILRSMSLMMAAAMNRNEQAASIREAHSRIRLLTNATPLGFNLWERNFKNIETNETAVRLFGLKDQREYLERFFELSPEYQPDGRRSKDMMAENLDLAFERGYLQFEWLHQKPDGTPVPSEITLVRLAYGDGHVVAGYIRDLREHKQMLAEIDRRNHLREIINQMADTLLRSEPDDFVHTLRQCMGMMTRAIHVDRMYIGRNQVENGTVYHAPLYEWSELSPPPLEAGAALRVSYDEATPLVREMLLRGECVNMLVRDMETADRRRLGARGALAVLLVPAFIRDEFWGFVEFNNCRDERLFTESEASVMHSGSLLIVNALLRNEDMLSIRHASARLEIALADAEEANNAKSDFLARMSHEIRTPLNAVIGLSELALSEKGLGREVESNLEKIYGAGETILSIVNDILDISKIESGKFELAPIRYDTPSLINDTVTLNIVRIGEKLVTFRLKVDENLPGALYGDDLRVKQIFNNLLSNALKYTPAGIVEWRISFERSGGDVWLVSSVKDTGVGIMPKDLKKLFSDYHQADAKANRSVEGTGLGLAIARRLAEMMDGSITVESEYGKGSTFHVRLRQASAPPDAPIGAEVARNLMDLRYSLSRRGQHTKLARINLSYAHVLVVDDIETNLDVVQGMLKPYRVNVDCAGGGAQAIEMIRAGSPRYSAIFMDHMMPGMDGLEAARIIREEIGTDYARDIPIVALTANALLGNEEMFLAHGFQDFISKPIDIAKLDAVLRRWVRNKALEKEFLTAAAPGTENGRSVNMLSRLGAIAIDGLDTRRAAERFSGDGEVLIDVLRSYAVNTGPLLADLRACLEAGNLAGYAIVAHGIKGSSNGIFAQAVSRAAAELEMAANAGDLDAVKAGHPAFENISLALINDIRRALDIFDAAVGKPAAVRPAPEILQELRASCRAVNMDRVDAVMERLEAFRYEHGEKLVAWLREQVNNMNFEAIVEGEWPSEGRDGAGG